jgi:DNA-binding transcriptional ArsR family regulator
MVEKDTCDIYCFDEEKVNRVQEQISRNGTRLSAAVQLFKALADENRTKVIYALCQEKELCVCDVANIIGSSVATASHHLRTLRGQGLVTYRREGKMAFYSLVDPSVKALMQLAVAQNQEVTSHV